MGIKSKFTEYLNYKDNVKKAAVVLNAKWNELNNTEKDTWLINTPYSVDRDGQELDKDGYNSFMHHFMSKFGTQHNNNNTVLSSINLSNGASKNYSDRESRTFIVS